MSDVTGIISRIEDGDPIAAEELLPLIYDELRKLAAAKLSHEKPGQTLSATALVHEAYLRLLGCDPGSNVQPWGGRGHFFAAAAEAMRRILIEQARRKRALKSSGSHEERDLAEISDIACEPATEQVDLLALDEALEKLDRHSPRKAQLVKLRYFAGLSLDEAAKVLGVATSTASADWLYAKGWLKLEMQSTG